MAQDISVLIIDDEDLVREALSMVLDLNGFTSTTTHCAQDALDLIENNSFQLIITDLVMPEMDGVDLIKKLRKHGDRTPIITLTGGARIGQNNMSRNALEAGAQHAMRKPVTKQELLDAISTVLFGKKP